MGVPLLTLSDGNLLCIEVTDPFSAVSFNVSLKLNVIKDRFVTLVAYFGSSHFSLDFALHKTFTANLICFELDSTLSVVLINAVLLLLMLGLIDDI